MFLASKLLSFVTQPLAWVALLLTGALIGLSLRRQWGSKLVALALALLLLQGWEPLPDAVLRTLETQYPASAANRVWTGYAGVIVLGGALEPAYVWEVAGQAALNEAAERMTAPIALLRQNPQLHLLFTGGEGELFANGLSEAERARIFFNSMALAPDRVTYESASRTTHDNAVMSAKLPGIDPTRPWLLLTSAWHMPRAMASFRKAGWNVFAYPVDFRTGSSTPWTQYSLETGTRKWNVALHELLGWLAYRMAGWA